MDCKGQRAGPGNGSTTLRPEAAGVPKARRAAGRLAGAGRDVAGGVSDPGRAVGGACGTGGTEGEVYW